MYSTILVVVKVSVCKQYNELLTAFATTVSEWGKSTKNVFPKEKKNRIYLQIYWKPILPPVNPDEYSTDTAHVLGHEMGLKLSPLDENYVPWLIVKKSGMEKGGGRDKRNKRNHIK